MGKRKKIVPLLPVLLSVLLLLPVRAAGTPSFLFELTANGKSAETVRTGDVVTVLLTLRRTDEKSAFTMHSMQDELRYDTDFFRLVEDGEMVSEGVRTADVSRGSGLREFYMNYTDLHGGRSWAADTIVGSIQLKVIAEEGSGVISNQDYLVSLPDGSGSYVCRCADVTITVSNNCTVTLLQEDGREERITVPQGSLLTKPDDPVREGWRFTGWFRDEACTIPWDFETDRVNDSSVTLYPGWEKNEGAGFCWLWLFVPLLLLLILLLLLRKKVEFETYCDEEIKTMHCWRGKKIARPRQIVRPGYMFEGWYKDDFFNEPFDFDNDEITENTILYARWI